MNFLLTRGGIISRKDSIKSSSIMSCDSSSSSSSSSSSGCCSNLSSSTAQVSGEEEVAKSGSFTNKSISSPCHSGGGVHYSALGINGNCFPDKHHFLDLNSCHGHQQTFNPSRSSSIPSSRSSCNGSISSSSYHTSHSEIDFGPMGTIKRKNSFASTHLNGPVLPLTSITRSLAKHSDADCCLVELDDKKVLINPPNSGHDNIAGAVNGNVLLQSNVQYGTLKMRKSFRSKEACPSMHDPRYNNPVHGFNHRPTIHHRSFQMANNGSCAVNEREEVDEEEMMLRRMSRDLNGSCEGGDNFGLDQPSQEDGQSDNLPLPPPPETNLTQSLSTLSLISLPPPPPEFSCNTLDTNTLSSVSSSSPSSSSSPPSTATHSLERSCSSIDPFQDNTLTRANVRMHKKHQVTACNMRQKYPGSSQNHSYHGNGAVGKSYCCQAERSSLSHSSASSSSYEEDVSCDGLGPCSECPPIIQQYHKQKQLSSDKGAVSKRYQIPKVNGQTPCCISSKGAVGGRVVPVRSASCYTRDVGIKQKYIIRTGSRDDYSAQSSHIQQSSHFNPRPNELVNARRYKPMYSSSSSSSCSSRDDDDQSCSLRECQSPEDTTMRRLESVENINPDFHNSSLSQHDSHKNQAQSRMKAKISGLNRSDQPIYDSVFTFRKQPQQDISIPVINDSEAGHRQTEEDDLPLPPPPPELREEQSSHCSNQQISINSPNNQLVYGVINKERKNKVDSSFHHPPLNRSPMKGPLTPAPEEFVKNLHRVMEKKWKVAQTLSGDFSEEIVTSSFHPRSLLDQDQFASSQAMDMREPSSSPSLCHNEKSHLPPPPPSHYHKQDNGHQVQIDTSSHVPAPPKLTFLQPLQYQNQQQSQKFPPPPPIRSDTSFYDVLPISVRPFNRAINQQTENYDSFNPVSGRNGHSFKNGYRNPSICESPPGINQIRNSNHPTANGSSPSSSSSSGLFSRMNPFRRSSKVSSICSSNSSSSNYSSSSSTAGVCSKGAPPPPPKRSDKTKLSHLKI